LENFKLVDHKIISVKKLFEEELKEVRIMYEETNDPDMKTMFEQVIKYLEMRLDGRVE
jgi:hypothetical protein